MKITLLSNISINNINYCNLPADGIFDGNGKTISLSGDINGLFTTNYNTLLDSIPTATKEDKLESASKIQNLKIRQMTGYWPTHCNKLPGLRGMLNDLKK